MIRIDPLTIDLINNSFSILNIEVNKTILMLDLIQRHKRHI